jgi:hypothetical protein
VPDVTAHWKTIKPANEHTSQAIAAKAVRMAAEAIAPPRGRPSGPAAVAEAPAGEKLTTELTMHMDSARAATLKWAEGAQSTRTAGQLLRDMGELDSYAAA